jgi:uridylate kinase
MVRGNMNMPVTWKNILIKMSGEALAGESRFGFDHQVMADIAREIVGLKDMGLQVSLTIGGGNIFRGSYVPKEIERVTGDYMGMLATVINGLALRDIFEAMGKPSILYSSLEMPSVAKPYRRREALRELKDGKILIIAGGIGRPYFTTDTTAALSALELKCDLIIKATNVDGIYSANPSIDPSAEWFGRITYQEVLERDLRVMDLTAITLLKDNNLPLIVLNIHKKGNLARTARGESVGSFVSNKV